MGMRGGAPRSSADRTASGVLEDKSRAEKRSRILLFVSRDTIRKATFLVEAKKNK